MNFFGVDGVKNKLYISFSILFCIATLFMGVGYASINSISLGVSGEMTAQAQDGIFITEVKYNDELSNNVNVADSKINSSHQNTLDSIIVLNSEKDSKIVFDITIYNAYDVAYKFDNVSYVFGDVTYSNENIGFSLNGLNEGDILNGNDSITFEIMFSFKNDISLENNILKSLLKFNFSIPVYYFDYVGSLESFTIENSGIYKVELWGAEGGKASTYKSGKGAYTVGFINYSVGDILYINVGGQGVTASATSTLTVGGYNGGGGAYYSAGTGGGATDIRFGGNSLNDRIMVAAGGGGAGIFSEAETGGAGGTLVGMDGGNYISSNGDNNGYHGGTGGTQIAGGVFGDYWTGSQRENCFLGKSGSFGFGGAGGYEVTYEHGAGAGGGGYYGGGGGSERNGGGAGGSSYISGHIGCVAITSAVDTTPLINSSTSDVKHSYHYSGKKFDNTNMISGDDSMPTYDGSETMIGNTGNGYAKITFVKEL